MYNIFLYKKRKESRMEDLEKNNKNPLIREHIVPKKNAKKILLTVAGTVGLALLFGVVAGFAFTVVRDLFGRETAPSDAQIIILPRNDRDELQGNEDLLLPESSTETEPAGDPTDQDRQDVTVQDVFRSIEKSLVRVTLVRPAGEDWFNEPQTSRKEGFAIPVAESEEAVFLLTDASAYTEGTTFHITFGNEIMIIEPYGVDTYTKMAILKIQKEHLKGELPLVRLGNSSGISIGDRVFLAGTVYGRYAAIDEGRVTYYEPSESAMDGYQQLFYTGMQRAAGGAGILMNEAGDVIGWMSDYSAKDGTSAVAAGITPLKYIIEGLYRNEKAALLGIKCRSLAAEETVGTERASGLYVQEVLQDSPAFAAGIQAGDRIISLNGRQTTTNRMLQVILAAEKAGSEIEITVGRINGGEEEQIRLTAILGER